LKTTPQIFERPSFIPKFENCEYFKDKYIGLTGHRGILGSILLRRLKESNVHVEPYPHDIIDCERLYKWFKNHQFTHFFHFAAIVSINKVEKNILRAFKTNVIGTYNICEQIMKTQNNCWFFFSSTSHIYQPTSIKNIKKLSIDSPKALNSIYGETKLASEKLIKLIFRNCSTDACIGRIFSFTSPTQKEPFLVPTIMRRVEEITNNAKLEVNNGDSIRDFMSAEVVIDCILHLASKRFCGTLNIGSGEGKNVFKIAQEIVKLSNKNIKIDVCNSNTPNAYIADVKELKKFLLS